MLHRAGSSGGDKGLQNGAGAQRGSARGAPGNTGPAVGQRDTGGCCAFAPLDYLATIEWRDGVPGLLEILKAKHQPTN